MGDPGVAAVEFGIQLPIQAQSSLFVEPWEAGAGASELTAIAQACEQAGFSYVAVCDHIAVPADKAEAMGTTWWDTVATLSYLAAVTTRVRLLSHIACVAYRHPLQTAKQWLTLDNLSSGRTIVGVGAGHVDGEFAALGIDFRRRGALLDEAIDALRTAFADEFSSHSGTEWSWKEMGQRPRPIQDTIPIWVAGSSDAAIRRAATRGDGWLPQGPPPDGMAAAVARLHEWRDQAGRADQAFAVGGLSGPLYIGTAGCDERRSVSGTPDRIAGYLRTLTDAGVDQIQVAFRSRDHHELCDQIAAFAAEVAPLVRKD
ncbi:MAG TPA: TIGR03619 family F420-dependent LLM class oxidoreductase [Acidimicrobiales bacterium]|jgi:probable F420-dependent oxidoreductase